MLYRLIQYLTWHVLQPVNRLVFHVNTAGIEPVNRLETGGVIFIANHSSKWDPFLIGSNIPWSYYKKIKGLQFMAFPKYTDEKWYKGYLRLIGTYPVYSQKGDYEKALAGTVRVLRENYSLVMFPTGKRGPELKTSEARPGIAFLAEKLDPLIIPVFVNDSYKIGFCDFVFCRRHVNLKFGTPFRWREVASPDDDLRTRAGKIMEKVAELAGVKS